MKTNIQTRFFPFIEFNMLQKRFWKQKAGAQALQKYIKSSNVFLKKASITPWKQKLTNITMKTKIHTRLFPLIEFSKLQKRFWKQKAGAQAL